MSYAENPYRATNWQIAAYAEEDERAAFIRRTYLHLGGAVLAFAAIEAVLLNTPAAESMVTMMLRGGQMGWLVVLGAFMLVSWIADRWAQSSTSLGTQYAGLALYVVAEAVIFLPLLYIANMVDPQGLVIPTAGLATLTVFGGLSAVVFFTKAELSMLRGALACGGFVALGFILCSAIFGFGLGMLFTVAMIALASGYILYHTSMVLHHYRTDQHVAAALALFASVALLFWYILQLVLRLTSRD